MKLQLGRSGVMPTISMGCSQLPFAAAGLIAEALQLRREIQARERVAACGRAAAFERSSDARKRMGASSVARVICDCAAFSAAGETVTDCATAAVAQRSAAHSTREQPRRHRSANVLREAHEGSPFGCAILVPARA